MYVCIRVTCNVCPPRLLCDRKYLKRPLQLSQNVQHLQPFGKLHMKEHKARRGREGGRSAMLHLSLVVTVCGLIKSSHYTVSWYMPCRETTTTTTTPWRNCKVRVRVSDFIGASVCVCVWAIVVFILCTHLPWTQFVCVEWHGDIDIDSRDVQGPIFHVAISLQK